MVPQPEVQYHPDGSWTEIITVDGGRKMIVHEHDVLGRITSTITTLHMDDGAVTVTLWTDPGTDHQQTTGTTTFPDATHATFMLREDGTRVTVYELPDRTTVTAVYPNGTTQVDVTTTSGEPVTRRWLIDTRTGRPIGDSTEIRSVLDLDNGRTYVTTITTRLDGSKVIREQVFDEHGDLLDETVREEPPPGSHPAPMYAPPEGNEQQFTVGGGGGSGDNSHVFGGGSGFVTVKYTDWWMHTEYGEIYLGTEVAFQTAEGNSWP